MYGFSIQTITALVEVVTGGPGLDNSHTPIGIYRKGAELEMFLGAVGLELPVGVKSRVPGVRDVLIRNNKTSEGSEAIIKLIEQVADPREYLQYPDKLRAVVDYLNARLKGDGYELQRVGETYKLLPFSSQESVSSVSEKINEIQIPSKVPQIPILIVTKSEAQEKITQQINKGKAIANIPTSGIDSLIFDDKDLEHERTKFLNWIDFNTKLLKLIFVEDSIADKYYQASYPEPFMDARIVTKAKREFLSDVENSITELEGILKKLELVPESPEVTTHKSIPKKCILNKTFIRNLLRASIKHLPFCGPFLYDVIYGTLDSQAAQNETNRQPKPLKSSPVFEKWYQNRTIQAALIGAFVLLLVSIIGWLITLYINKPKADSGEIETISSENKLSLSLKELCQDIDSRPLVQQNDTAKSYIGIMVENERLILVAADKIGTDQDFHLTMMLPEEWDGQTVIGRHILFNVNIEKYPELVAAKQGLEIHVSGRIEYIGNQPYISLTDVSLNFN